MQEQKELARIAKGDAAANNITKHSKAGRAEIDRLRESDPEHWLKICEVLGIPEERPGAQIGEDQHAQQREADRSHATAVLNPGKARITNITSDRSDYDRDRYLSTLSADKCEQAESAAERRERLKPLRQYLIEVEGRKPETADRALSPSRLNDEQEKRLQYLAGESGYRYVPPESRAPRCECVSVSRLVDPPLPARERVKESAEAEQAPINKQAVREQLQRDSERFGGNGGSVTTLQPWCPPAAHMRLGLNSIRPAVADKYPNTYVPAPPASEEPYTQTSRYWGVSGEAFLIQADQHPLGFDDLYTDIFSED